MTQYAKTSHRILAFSSFGGVSADDNHTRLLPILRRWVPLTRHWQWVGEDIEEADQFMILSEMGIGQKYPRVISCLRKKRCRKGTHVDRNACISETAGLHISQQGFQVLSRSCIGDVWAVRRMRLVESKPQISPSGSLYRSSNLVTPSNATCTTQITAS